MLPYYDQLFVPPQVRDNKSVKKEMEKTVSIIIERRF
jgi:hypothetical protein